MSVSLAGGELLSPIQLEDFGRTLAARHKVYQKSKGSPLLLRLGQNQDILRNGYNLINSVVRNGHPLSPAAEWLLDNFYLIDEQIRTARIHLPREYNSELPQLDSGYPRVYELVREFVSHRDAHFERESLLRFVAAYQDLSELKIGELWAIPIMLRLALIENLRHVAEHIAAHYIDQSSAQYWVERIVKTSMVSSKDSIIEIAELARSKPRFSSAFVSELTRGIQAACPNPTLPLEWIEQHAAEHGISLESHQHRVSQQHAHNQLSISNSIGSLRLIDSEDWRDFVESTSLVEQRLRQDPAGIYEKMDFLTRDAYRHMIEYSARYYRGKSSGEELANKEILVADTILSLAKESSGKNGETSQAHHIGEYILGGGREKLEKNLQLHLPLGERLRRAFSRYPMQYYFGSQVIAVALLTLWPLKILYNSFDLTSSDHTVNFMELALTLSLSLALLVASTSAAGAIVNWLITLFLKPRVWPRFDFSKGVPDDCRTLVAIPSMLSSIETVKKLIDDLEIRYLGNQDDNISFALLTDFVDASTQSLPTDQIILESVRDGVMQLNQKYKQSGKPGPFHLLHRPRLWNGQEGVWMGHERKRGKLADLNRYLSGGTSDCFMTIVGDHDGLDAVRYIITLDTDTRLPRESARQLIATMAHPLSKAKIDPKSGIVREGYGILQPRVTTFHQKEGASLLMRLASDDGCIDPYTKSVSDVYQDLFQEGSFIGKGIYDLEAFRESTADRFPENRILSHDLIEGCFARCGFVTDVQVIEEYPSTYSSDTSRRHRWIRGDWQIASWLLPRVMKKDGQIVPNQLSSLSRWKVLDNLRRSIIPLTMLFLLTIAWQSSHIISTTISTAVLTYLILPHCLVTVSVRRRSLVNVPFQTELRDLMRKLLQGLAMAGLSLAFLPFEAFLAVDATLRSSYRLIFSKRRLLEWCTAADSHQSSMIGPLSYWRTMWIAPLFGGTSLAGMIIGFYTRSPILVVVASMWLVAPFIAWFISRPSTSRETKLTKEQTHFLETLARRTWHFFETFVTAGDHWLPPDNFQEYPKPVIAHRTSPTNIGLGLLSTLGAYDFGYIPVSNLLDRVEGTIQTLEGLQRYKGHFYNWYDTLTLEPLNPLYVSTVDSGNLAASFIILKQGLLELAVTPNLWSKRILVGLQDTFLVLKESVSKNSVILQSNSPFDSLEKTLETYSIDPTNTLAVTADELITILEKISLTVAEIQILEIKDTSNWLNIFSTQLEIQLQDLRLLKNELETKSFREKLCELVERIEALTNQDYQFIYNPSNKLLAIGYNVNEVRQDNSYYDLLASEARLASFLAIATGHLPQEHWFALGRQLTNVGGAGTLLSWSGSMFEYLMPNLFLPNFKGTLLDQASKQAVACQIQYGHDHGVPWGISESGYNLMDAQSNYQYRAFGVPNLGFKRDLDLDLVVSPYATAMSLMIDPLSSIANLKSMEARGYMSEFGFYEAIDFTRNRLPSNIDSVIIKSFMAHHQGMSFLSLASLLLDEPMQRRMQNDPRVKATELLLYERVPRERPAFSHILIDSEITSPVAKRGPVNRVIKNPNQAIPDVHLLGNGSFHTAITSAGGGFSKWNDLLLTRWREDGTTDGLGAFIYIREPKTDNSWSVTYQPTLVKSGGYNVIFSEGRAEFRRLDNEIETHLEIAVSPDDNAEVRHLKITNRSDHVREIEITTYNEVVLSPLAADVAHPSFNKLFVETEILPSLSAILCRRRGRMAGDDTPWLCHGVVVFDAMTCETSFETNRVEFVGRNRDLKSPIALETKLSGSAGAVLDPVMAVRHIVKIEAGATITVNCILGLGKDRNTAVQLLEELQERDFSERTMELASAHNYMMLRQINSSSSEAILFGKMLAPLLYGSAPFRTLPNILKSNVRSQSNLWGYGISGDLPILLVRIQNQDGMDLVRLILRAHAYWHRKGMAIDLVIWNEDSTGYRQELHNTILQAVASAETANRLNSPGGIFLRRPDQMPEEDRILIQSVARSIYSDQAGSLEDQIKSKRTIRPPTNKQLSIKGRRSKTKTKTTFNSEDIAKTSQGNRFGGFSENGNEYIIHIGASGSTPAPWINVISNPDFGTLVTESGAAFTWSENAREHRLTPWSNDPVIDPSGECLYLRDELNGEVWSPTPAPIPGNGDYTAIHGYGYTKFRTETFGIASELTQFVSHEAPVKFFLLKVTNSTSKSYQLSATLFLELILGDDRAKTKDFVVTESDPPDFPNRMMLARNLFSSDFSGRTVFLSSTSQVKSLTGDRLEFLGRNGSTGSPAAMESVALSGRVGALLDPCLAMQVSIDLAPNETQDLAFVFGCAKSTHEARMLAKLFDASTARVYMALEGVSAHWSKILMNVQIETPDSSLNLLGNGWLLYQTISSRIWGRTSFYQSGGAYGFRDQLQDVMAVLYTAPVIARQHILRCAAHQFSEGDVQHWWHPPTNKGVRTRFSDDYLWLPYVTSQYIRITGDYEILDEMVPFIEARLLSEGEESNYGLPSTADGQGSIYEHCVRALKRSFSLGEHGLPLIGAGDWNDGMNQVGLHGKGESVWLGFFLYDTLQRFAILAKYREDSVMVQKCETHSQLLVKNIEKNSWDGAWYTRAYFDDGSPLGVSANTECRIDSLPQSWSVISKAADPARVRLAMDSVYTKLVREAEGLVLVLDPPFDKAEPNPGYIAGYLPGVRENGGQYTHAALWAITAFAEIGDYDRAMKLLKLIDPIRRGESNKLIDQYKVEPYVVAADVYNNPAHVGRGGWTWYTGSAALYYRVIIETILGFDLRADRLKITPKIPGDWQEFKIQFNYKSSSYSLVAQRSDTKLKKQTIYVDDIILTDTIIQLHDDGNTHQIKVLF